MKKEKKNKDGIQNKYECALENLKNENEYSFTKNLRELLIKEINGNIDILLYFKTECLKHSVITMDGKCSKYAFLISIVAIIVSIFSLLISVKEIAYLIFPFAIVIAIIFYMWWFHKLEKESKENVKYQTTYEILLHIESNWNEYSPSNKMDSIKDDKNELEK